MLLKGGFCFLRCISVAFLFATQTASAVALKSLRTMFRHSPLDIGPSPVGVNTLRMGDIGIVDDLIPEHVAMDLNLNAGFVVRWNSIVLGVGTDGNRNDLASGIAQLTPKIDFKPEDNTKYELLLVDVDAPNGRGSYDNHPYLHWLVSDIKDATSIPSMEQIPYVVPRIPKSNTIHRYVFLLLKETSKTPEGENLKGVPPPEVQNNGAITFERRNFDVVKFIDENFLKLVAVDFFMSNH